MNAIINRLTEIEETAASIVEHAEEQKAVLDKEYEEMQKQFDLELEQKTKTHIEEIQSRLAKETKDLQAGQNGAGGTEIASLRKEYDEKHTEYAVHILKKITEV